MPCGHPRSVFSSLFMFFLLSPISAFGQKLKAPNISSEASHRLQLDLESGKTSRNIISFQQNVEVFLPKNFQFRTQVLGQADLERPVRGDKKTDIQFRTLTLQHTSDLGQINLGMQEISWGETFGFPVTDIVNPRNLNEPWYVESRAAKMPIPLLNIQLLFSGLDIQFLFVPLIQVSRGPESLFGIPVKSQADRKWFKDVEGGVRLGGLVKGWDLHVFGYHHESRLPVYELSLQSGKPELVRDVSKITAAGLNLSKAGEALVFRLDSIAYFQIPLQTFTPSGVPIIFKENLLQSVVALDYTSDGGRNFGLQYQADVLQKVQYSSVKQVQHWAGIHIYSEFFLRKVEADFTALAGVEANPAYWFKPKVTVFLGDSWKTSLEWHFVKPGKNPRNLLFAADNRMISELTWKF